MFFYPNLDFPSGHIMKAGIYSALIVVAIVVVAGLAVFLTYEKNHEIDTAAHIEDGFECTVNGKSVTDGDAVSVLNNGKIEVHIESSSAMRMLFEGRWVHDGNAVEKSADSETAVDSFDVEIELEKGDYEGSMYVKAYGADDLYPVTLTFDYDGTQLSASVGGSEIASGSTYSFTSDGTITLTSKVGTKNINYDGTWSDGQGGSSGASGYEYGTETAVYVTNTAYFGEMTGTIKFWVSDE